MPPSTTLSQALVNTVANHRGEIQALATVLGALPAGDWRADAGTPCVLEALLETRPSGLGNAHHGRDGPTAWAELVSWAFRERAVPSHDVCVRLLRKAMDLPVDARAVLDQVWTLTAPSLTPTDRLPLLNEALASSWWVQDVAKRLVAMPGSTDLSVLTEKESPFTHVRSPEMLAMLMDAGFDPYQVLKDRSHGLWTIQNRPTHSFGGPQSFNGVVRLLHQRITRSGKTPMEQCRMLLASAQHPDDLTPWFKELGPEAHLVRDEQGNTLLHQVMAQKPNWALVLFEKIKDSVKHPRLALWGVLNQYGEHALLHGFLQNVDTSVWWAQWLNNATGTAIAETLPRFDDPKGAWVALMKIAFRHKKPLPSLTGVGTWDLIRRMGGTDEEAIRTEFLKNPHWQEAFERLVAQVRLNKKAPAGAAWSGLAGWMSGVGDDHPWVMGFRLLDVVVRLPLESAMAQASGQADLNQQQRLDECRDEAFGLIDRGASWGWANAMVNKRGIPVKHPAFWTAVGQRWETRQLNVALQDTVEPEQRPRARL